MKKIFLASSIAIAAVSGVMMLSNSFLGNAFVPNLPFDSAVKQAFELKGIKLSDSQVKLIRENVRLGVLESCKSPQGNSKVGFTAVEVADQLDLNPAVYSLIVDKIGEVIESVAAEQTYCQAQTYPPIRPIDPIRPYHPRPDLDWKTYFKKTVSLNNDSHFLSLLQDKAYSPVHISWEDIGRYENSVWGDRISDVGIWVRKDEKDPSSAELALSVRRDNNFSDKVLVVPADKIKIHQKIGTKTIEKTLPQRLKELGLSSALRDKNVIVSNQFSIVPVPARSIQQR